MTPSLWNQKSLTDFYDIGGELVGGFDCRNGSLETHG
jgi:hypothetical protein